MLTEQKIHDTVVEAIQYYRPRLHHDSRVAKIVKKCLIRTYVEPKWSYKDMDSPIYEKDSEGNTRFQVWAKNNEFDFLFDYKHEFNDDVESFLDRWKEYGSLPTFRPYDSFAVAALYPLPREGYGGSLSYLIVYFNQDNPPKDMKWNPPAKLPQSTYNWDLYNSQKASWFPEDGDDSALEDKYVNDTPHEDTIEKAPSRATQVTNYNEEEELKAEKVQPLIDHCKHYRDLPQHVNNQPHIDRWNEAIRFLNKSDFIGVRLFGTPYANRGWKPWKGLLKMVGEL